MERKVIAVINQKGGAGKTTTALNVAAEYAAQDKRVLLVDADPQGTVTTWADRRQRGGLEPVERLQVVPYRGTPKDMPAWIQKHEFDVAVIDSPPRADDAHARAILSSAKGGTVIVPIQPSTADLWAAEATFKLIEEAQKHFPLKWAVLLSRVKPATTLGREFTDLIKSMSLPLLTALTTDRVAYQSAISACLTIQEYEPPSGRAAGEIRTIAANIETMK